MSTTVSTPRKIAATATAGAALAKGTHTPVDATSGALTMTLPTTAAAGVVISVEKTDASANAVTISGTFRGTASTLPLTTQFEGRTFLSEGSGSWRPTSDHRTAASLNSTYSAVDARPAGPLVITGLGDSIMAGLGNTEPANHLIETSPILQAVVQSNGLLVYGGNYGVAGETSTQILARVSQVLTSTPKPRVCLVEAGTNDGSPTATMKANIDSIVKQLRAAGIEPVLMNRPPNSSTDPAYQTAIRTHNLWIADYCARNNVILIDCFGTWVDSVTGDWPVAYKRDATHPNGRAYKAIGAQIVAALNVRGNPYRGCLDKVDPTNLAGDGLFTTGTAGVPTGWTDGGGTTGHTYSLVTGDAKFRNGTAFRASFDGTAPATQQIIFRDFTGTPGDVFEVGFKFYTTGIDAAIGANGAGTSPWFSVHPVGYPSNTTVGWNRFRYSEWDGYFVGRFVMPSDGKVRCHIRGESGPASAAWSYTVGEFSMKNLTNLGIA